MFDKVKSSTKSAKRICATASASAVVASATTLGFAGSGPTTAVNPANVVKNIIKIVFDIFFYIGLVLLAWSIGMLVLAFKNEDADSKSRAIMLLIVSAVLMGIKFLFNRLGIAGFNNL